MRIAFVSLALAAVASAAPAPRKSGNVQPFSLSIVDPPFSIDGDSCLQVNDDGVLGIFPKGTPFFGVTQNAVRSGNINNYKSGSESLFLRAIFGDVSKGASKLMTGNSKKVSQLGPGFKENWTISNADVTDTPPAILGYEGSECRFSACEDITGSGNWTVYYNPGSGPISMGSTECNTFFDIEVNYE